MCTTLRLADSVCVQSFDWLFIGSSLRRSFDMLREAETKLKAITNSKFDSAVTTRDIPSVERFFKIYPLLGLREEGLVKFAKWLSMQAGAKSLRESLRTSTTSSNTAAIVDIGESG